MSEQGEASSKIDSLWDETSIEYEEILRTFLLPVSSVTPDQVKQVASVGCSLFYEAQALRRFFPNAEITGYEQDARIVSSINKAIFLPHDRLVLKKGVVGNGVLKPETTDVIIVRHPDIHKGITWRRAFQESVSALTQNGRLVVTTLTEMEMNQVRPMIAGTKILVDSVNKRPGETVSRGVSDSCILIAGKK